VRVTALTEPAAEQLVGVAEVFDQYRRHYSQPVVAGQTLVSVAMRKSPCVAKLESPLVAS
jgi:hypothetical protein